MKLSIVVPAFNEEKYIANCLEALEKYLPSEVIEIIVVDNASTDKTAKIAKKFKQVKVVKEKKKGVSYARQKGLMEAKGKYVAFIDADTQITPNWYKQVKKELSKKDVVCLSGPSYYYDFSRIKNMNIKLYWKFVVKTAYKVTGYVIQENNFIVKKDILLSIGGFDTNIRFYGDGADIGKRLSKVGKVKFSNKLIVFSSARRFNKEGFYKVGAKYAANYLSKAIFDKTFSNKYKNIR